MTSRGPFQPKTLYDSMIYDSTTKLLCIAAADANPLAAVKFPSDKEKLVVRVLVFLVAYFVFLIDQSKDEMAVSEICEMCI